MKDFKHLSTKYWPAILAVFVSGIIIGFVAYYIIYTMVMNSINQRIKQNGRLGYIIEVLNYNIGGKGMPLCCRGLSLYSTTREVKGVTKKEAIIKLKGEWRAAQTATKMKVVKALYNEVKAMDMADNEQLPPSVEQKVSSV